MKIAKITFLLLFVCTIASAQVTPLEKTYGVTVEIRNKSLNDIYKADRLFDKNKYEESLEILLKVAKADPVILNTYESLYKVSAALKNHSVEVINCFTTGKKIYNDNDEISYFLAELLTLNKEYKKALAEYDNAIAIQKNNKNKSFYLPHYYSSRGYCYIQLMMFSNAEKDYSDFLALKPKNTLGLLNRGFCYYKLGETEKAKKDWKIASDYGSSEARELLQKLNQNKF